MHAWICTGVVLASACWPSTCKWIDLICGGTYARQVLQTQQLTRPPADHSTHGQSSAGGHQCSSPTEPAQHSCPGYQVASSTGAACGCLPAEVWIPRRQQQPGPQRKVRYA
eukprot:364781-Chlamydomonas_euryale.AAC.6